MQVCTKDARGKKVKDGQLSEEMTLFFNTRSSAQYPDLVDMKGKRVLKQILAEEMLKCIPVDTSGKGSRVWYGTSWSYRATMPSTCGETAALAGDWDAVPEPMRGPLQEVLPKEVDKCVQYHLKKDPSAYVESTMRMCLAMEDCKFASSQAGGLPCQDGYRGGGLFPTQREWKLGKTWWKGKLTTIGCGAEC